MTLGRQHLEKLNLISFIFPIIPTSTLHNKSKHFRSSTKRLNTESQFLPFAVKVRIWKFLYRPVAEPGDKKAVQKHRPTIRQERERGLSPFSVLVWDEFRKTWSTALTWIASKTQHGFQGGSWLTASNLFINFSLVLRLREANTPV